jgi:hypothetical protein
MYHFISADESEYGLGERSRTGPEKSQTCSTIGTKRQSTMAVQGLRTRYNSEFDATILLDQMDQIRDLDLHWAFTSLAAMIGAAMCAFAVGICLWKF